MPFPVAGAVLVGLTALKAKAFGMEVVAEQRCIDKSDKSGNGDPWGLKVDLTSDEEKRKIAQAIMESSDVLVQHERRQMREQAEILSRLEFDRANRPGESGGTPRVRSRFSTPGKGVPAVRPLVSSPGVGHQGLHSTGSVFVTSVDSTNADAWFQGGAPFRAILVTEEDETPEWFLKLAKEHHSLCYFGKARCTDPQLMARLSVTRSEPLPVVVVVTTYRPAIAEWQANQPPGTCFIQPGIAAETSVALRSHASQRETPEALAAKIVRAIRVEGIEKEYHVHLLMRASNPDAKWF